jgi:hypothetical protein
MKLKLKCTGESPETYDIYNDNYLIGLMKVKNGCFYIKLRKRIVYRNFILKDEYSDTFSDEERHRELNQGSKAIIDKLQLNDTFYEIIKMNNYDILSKKDGQYYLQTIVAKTIDDALNAYEKDKEVIKIEKAPSERLHWIYYCVGCKSVLNNTQIIMLVNDEKYHCMKCGQAYSLALTERIKS